MTNPDWNLQVKVGRGRADTGAHHRAIEVARQLLAIGRWPDHLHTLIVIHNAYYIHRHLQLSGPGVYDTDQGVTVYPAAYELVAGGEYEVVPIDATAPPPHSWEMSMKKLKTQIAALPTIQVDGETYLSYQAVTNTVAAFLFPQRPPTHPTDQIDAVGYQRVLETADTLCRELGYASVVKLAPPTVPFSEMGLYWTAAATALSPDIPQPATKEEPVLIHAGPDRIEMMQDGLLLDARLSQLGLDEVTRQHFKIPVTASDAVIDLMQRAVNSNWPNDFKGIWHDILGMCVAGGRDISTTERVFTVIIRGLGQRRYWRFKACIQQDNSGAPFLMIRLADEGEPKTLFELGHVVMTPGAAELGVDFAPYLSRYAQGDWGDDLDSFDRRQNDTAVKEGYRILSAYTIPIGDDVTERIWIITEADRSATTILLPSEY